ncbi:DUF6192 family protein [Streptomyces antarcticus]|uniref:DUF6192 family protein n=1 Tax=Streptomyces antarcticus TaxID=2996458 RepID=UPI0022AF74CD|nr:DUF6192 family protein [Streptomyces sp. H34-S5]MCZ4083273.1 DUF6192 family protein [Streptomyces sp. H34-S5]
MPALEVPLGFTRDAWIHYVHRGRRIIRTKSASNFELGDMLNEMTAARPRGEIGQLMALFSRQIRSSESSLTKYRYASKKWPPEMRRDDVPWNVHLVLAGKPDRFQLIREEPSDDLDPRDQGAWHSDQALRAVQAPPQAPATPVERIDTAKRLLRNTDEAATAITQLADRTEVLRQAIEDPGFRRAVRDASRDRAQRLEQAAEVPGPQARTGPGEPESGHPAPFIGPSVNYRDTPSSVLKILGQCASFCVSMQNTVVLAQEEMLTTEEEEAVLDSIKKVRAVCDWCEHVVTTGQADMDDELARLLGGEGNQL